MNIGFDAKRLFNNSTGLGNYSRTLVTALQQYFPDQYYFLYSTQTPVNQTTQSFFDVEQYSLRYSSHFFSSYWREFVLKRLLQQDTIGIFHGLSHTLPRGIQHSSTKSVVTVHDIISDLMPQYYRLIDRRFYHLKLKHSCRYADRIVAISENTKKDLIENYQVAASRISVIYQSCDALFYKQSNPKANKSLAEELQLPANFLLFVGAHNPRKNLCNLLRAYSQLKYMEDMPLLVVSKDPMSKAIQQLCQQLKIQQQVVWKSNVDTTHQLKVVYQAATALIYPSLYEGFGLPIIEALLCKTPVLCSNISSMPEAAGPDSWYFNPHQVDDIAACIQSFFQHQSGKKPRVEQSYAYAMRQFSPQNIALQWMRLYRNLL